MKIVLNFKIRIAVLSINNQSSCLASTKAGDKKHYGHVSYMDACTSCPHLQIVPFTEWRKERSSSTIKLRLSIEALNKISILSDDI